MDVTDIRNSQPELLLASRATRLVVAIIVITVLLNTFISAGLFSESLNAIIYFQSSATTASILFFNLISFLANPVLVTVVIGGIFLMHPKRIRSLVFLTFFLFNTYFMTILKAWYHEPRPFWYSQSIRQLEWTCPREYGNPSGHSWLVVVLFQPLFTDFLYPKSVAAKVIVCVFEISVLILVPFSRMYLGAHSGNQVFFGLLMGTSIVVLYRFGLQKYFYRLFEFIIFRSQQAKRKTLYVAILGVQCLTAALPAIIYAYSPTQDQEYIMILNQKCPGRITTSLGLNGGILLTSILISLVFGLIYGLLFCPEQTFMYVYGKWKFHPRLTTLQATLLKLVLQLLLLGAPLLFILIVSFVDMDIYLQYVLMSVLVTLSGYLFMSSSERLLLKTKTIARSRQPMGQVLI